MQMDIVVGAIACHILIELNSALVYIDHGAMKWHMTIV